MSAGAVIVNTSSEQAGNPSPDIVDYALTRAAVLNFAKSMAKQLASRGIRVTAVAPGPFWTPLHVNGGATAESCEASVEIGRWHVQASQRKLQRFTVPQLILP